MDGTSIASRTEYTDLVTPAGADYQHPNAHDAADETEQLTAHYLVCRLGAEATGYAERFARRLAAAGRLDNAAAWSRIAKATTDALARGEQTNRA